jgi:hypothetical protein
MRRPLATNPLIVVLCMNTPCFNSYSKSFIQIEFVVVIYGYEENERLVVVIW